MTNDDFKKQAAEFRVRRARSPVPQVDPERPLERPPETPDAAPAERPSPAQSEQPIAGTPSHPHITIVDTSERATNQSFSMYPSRHEQVARDLAYIEKRSPWKIWEDAMEEYVVRHYGKQYGRK